MMYSNSNSQSTRPLSRSRLPSGSLSSSGLPHSPLEGGVDLSALPVADAEAVISSFDSRRDSSFESSMGSKWSRADGGGVGQAKHDATFNLSSLHSGSPHSLPHSLPHSQQPTAYNPYSEIVNPHLYRSQDYESKARAMGYTPYTHPYTQQVEEYDLAGSQYQHGETTTGMGPTGTSGIARPSQTSLAYTTQLLAYENLTNTADSPKPILPHSTFYGTTTPYHRRQQSNSSQSTGHSTMSGHFQVIEGHVADDTASFSSYTLTEAEVVYSTPTHSRNNSGGTYNTHNTHSTHSTHSTQPSTYSRPEPIVPYSSLDPMVPYSGSSAWRSAMASHRLDSHPSHPSHSSITNDPTSSYDPYDPNTAYNPTCSRLDQLRARIHQEEVEGLAALAATRASMDARSAGIDTQLIPDDYYYNSHPSHPSHLYPSRPLHHASQPHYHDTSRIGPRPVVQPVPRTSPPTSRNQAHPSHTSLAYTTQLLAYDNLTLSRQSTTSYNTTTVGGAYTVGASGPVVTLQKEYEGKLAHTKDALSSPSRRNSPLPNRRGGVIAQTPYERTEMDTEGTEAYTEAIDSDAYTEAVDDDGYNTDTSSPIVSPVSPNQHKYQLQYLEHVQKQQRGRISMPYVTVKSRANSMTSNTSGTGDVKDKGVSATKVSSTVQSSSVQQSYTTSYSSSYYSSNAMSSHTSSASAPMTSTTNITPPPALLSTSPIPPDPASPIGLFLSESPSPSPLRSRQGIRQELVSPSFSLDMSVSPEVPISYSSNALDRLDRFNSTNNDTNNTNFTNTLFGGVERVEAYTGEAYTRGGVERSVIRNNYSSTSNTVRDISSDWVTSPTSPSPTFPSSAQEIETTSGSSSSSSSSSSSRVVSHTRSTVVASSSTTSSTRIDQSTSNNNSTAVSSSRDSSSILRGRDTAINQLNMSYVSEDANEDDEDDDDDDEEEEDDDDGASKRSGRASIVSELS